MNHAPGPALLDDGLGREWSQTVQKQQIKRCLLAHGPRDRKGSRVWEKQFKKHIRGSDNNLVLLFDCLHPRWRSSSHLKGDLVQASRALCLLWHFGKERCCSDSESVCAFLCLFAVFHGPTALSHALSLSLFKHVNGDRCLGAVLEASSCAWCSENGPIKSTRTAPCLPCRPPRPPASWTVRGNLILCSHLQ